MYTIQITNYVFPSAWCCMGFTQFYIYTLISYFKIAWKRLEEKGERRRK